MALLSTVLGTNFKGDAGPQGSSGISGFSGFSGRSGFSGATGSQGPQGDQGDQGIQGESGTSGFSGFSGESGFSGFSGTSGFSGETGPQGDQGIQGESGFSGTSGFSGFSGESGTSGFSGFSGAQGPIQTNIPLSTNTTVVLSDAGKFLDVATGVTINASTGFSAGDAVSIYNDSASNITITATGVTLRLAGTATTGNRTLAQRGLVTVLCVATNDYVISGAGIT
jgi:hypothetical protein